MLVVTLVGLQTILEPVDFRSHISKDGLLGSGQGRKLKREESEGEEALYRLGFRV